MDLGAAQQIINAELEFWRCLRAPYMAQMGIACKCDPPLRADALAHTVFLLSGITAIFSGTTIFIGVAVAGRHFNLEPLLWSGTIFFLICLFMTNTVVRLERYVTRILTAGGRRRKLAHAAETAVRVVGHEAIWLVLLRNGNAEEVLQWANALADRGDRRLLDVDSLTNLKRIGDALNEHLAAARTDAYLASLSNATRGASQ